ncbi:MAG: DNA-directed RNA polymerase subunit alpha [Chloroflexota bacterium]|nr:DNA-directed RNA polymerase subunit alpha [Chloroflexota bacterium]
MAAEHPMPTINVIEAGDRHGHFVVEPLPRGYGHTIGNPLRRVLLSSMPGAAITRISVDGVLHEFSELAFMREDVTQFILNLKEVRLRVHADGPIAALIEVKAPGEVTDASIQVGPEVEIINPDHHLATLDKKRGTLRVELVIERGVGYVGAEEQSDKQIGVIPLDARFTPVHRVQYGVERARVGQSTDWDRLAVQVWTDGTISPEEAISRASGILVDSYTLMAKVANPEEFRPIAVVDEPVEEAEPQTLVEELKLSNRALNCLKRHGIDTVEQLVEMSEDELFDLRGMGIKLVVELRERLAEVGLAVRGSELPSENGK